MSETPTGEEVPGWPRLDAEQIAEVAGVTTGDLGEFIEACVVVPDEAGRCLPGDVRRGRID